ncbi:MAG: ChbG/HpnK family deacetylase [bacterium]|nr:ChbG/HpnK family deacetylase [bacterium]
MKYLIINADDFGLSAPVNEGIIRAFEAGGITNATLMIKRASAGEAVRYAKNNRSLPLGLHLDLDDLLGGGRQGDERFKLDRIGAMLKEESFLKTLEAEIDGQIKAFKETGLELTHIDGHHHLHAIPGIFPRLIHKMADQGIKTVRLSQRFDLLKYPPIEWDDYFFSEMKALLKQKGIIYADHFITGWQPYDLQKMAHGVTELMTHPGTTEQWRIDELATLTSGEWSAAVEEEGIVLTSFRELAENWQRAR